MKLKRLLRSNLCIALIISFNIIGLQHGTPLPNTTTMASIYIPIIAKAQAPYWQAVRVGVEKAASDYGIQAVFEAPPDEEPPAIPLQLRMLEAALVNNPQAIALAAIDSRAVTPYLQQAAQAGIPVIGFDSGVDSPIVQTTVATDNYAAGELAADKMAELIGGIGKVGLIVHDLTSKTAVDRRDGFVDTMRNNYPAIELLPIQYSQGNTNLATVFAKRLILGHPDIKGLFSTSAGASDGVITAVKELNNTNQIEIIGFDSGSLLLDAIREGIVSGAITQDPVNMGYRTVETALRAYLGETLPSFIDTGFAWYDKSNIDSPEIAPLLYE